MHALIAWKVSLAVGRNKWCSKVLVAFSGQLLAVKNVLPSLGGFFRPILGRNKSYCPVLVGPSSQVLAVRNRTATAESWSLFSGHLLAVTNRTAEWWWLFWTTFRRNKSYCRVLVAFSGPRLAVTNVLSSLGDIALPSFRGFFQKTFGRNKSSCRFSVAFSGHSWPKQIVLPRVARAYRRNHKQTNRLRV